MSIFDPVVLLGSEGKKSFELMYEVTQNKRHHGYGIYTFEKRHTWRIVEPLYALNVLKWKFKITRVTAQKPPTPVYESKAIAYAMRGLHPDPSHVEVLYPNGARDQVNIHLDYKGRPYLPLRMGNVYLTQDADLSKVSQRMLFVLCGAGLFGLITSIPFVAFTHNIWFFSIALLWLLCGLGEGFLHSFVPETKAHRVMLSIAAPLFLSIHLIVEIGVAIKTVRNLLYTVVKHLLFVLSEIYEDVRIRFLIFKGHIGRYFSEQI